MDLSFGPESEVFRREVRDFLRLNWPSGTPAQERDERAFRRSATAQGYLYRGIPKIYGGGEQSADVVKAQIIREEFETARAPMEVGGIGMAMLVPTLLEHGALWQKEQFIRATVEGEIRWAQGYSEPGAGSDLASLKTHAQLRDGQWIINGQKIWTSMAHRAHYMFALVRTEPDAPKHAGISYLLIDLRQPQITVRPLKQMTGESHFCEVFFDNATTPANWMVGERGQGWAISKTTLKHERASIGTAGRSEDLLGKLIELARSTQRLGAPAIRDAQVRQDLAKLEAWVLAQKYSSYRLFSLAAAGEDPGLIGLLGKQLTTDIGLEVARIAQELIADAALLQPLPASAKQRRGAEKWLDQIMGSLGVSIAGGASNIQRNILAERGLGLPRDGSVSAGGDTP